MPDYLDHLDDPDSVAGLVWRRDGKIVEKLHVVAAERILARAEAIEAR